MLIAPPSYCFSCSSLKYFRVLNRSLFNCFFHFVLFDDVLLDFSYGKALAAIRWPWPPPSCRVSPLFLFWDFGLFDKEDFTGKKNYWGGGEVVILDFSYQDCFPWINPYLPWMIKSSLFSSIISRCIPYRYKRNSDGTLSSDLEVLVISSQKCQKMMFPKVCSISFI